MTNSVREVRIFFEEYLRFKKDAAEYIRKSDMTPDEKKAAMKDWKKSFFKHRTNSNEYFCQYRFPELSENQRSMYISRSSMQRIYRINIKNEVRRVFHEKARFLKVFKDYIKRDWMVYNADLPEDDPKKIRMTKKLRKILTSHDCIIKPFIGSLGIGVEKVCAVSTNEEVDEIIKNHLTNGRYMIEECIEGESSIAEFHPASLNTIRVITFSKNGKVVVFAGVFRMGNNNSVVDNYHANGIAAQIDVETGELMTDGFDENNVPYEYHPFSNKKIKGFRIPQWDKIKEFCINATSVIPDVYFAGWDVAVRSDGEIEFVEGNHAPDVDGIQTRLGRGIKKDVEKILKDLGVI